MSIDPSETPRQLPERPNLRHQGTGERPPPVRRGDVDDRRPVPDRPALRVRELAETQGSCRGARRRAGCRGANGSRPTEACDRHGEPRSGQGDDDREPGAASRATRLRQKRSIDLGGGMSSALAAAERHETRHRRVDDRQRVGRAPGWGRPADARRAQWGSRADDGGAGRTRSERQCQVGWNLPIIFAACEALDPAALTWLLDHGADPHITGSGEFSGTALDYVIGSYSRSPRLGACIDALLRVGGRTKYDIPVVLDLLAGRLDRLRDHLAADSSFIERRFPQLDFGATGGRMLTLKGATLLHVAAEYQNLEAVRLLLDLGADVNARATVDAAGIGGQTAIFHAVTQGGDAGIPVIRLLLTRGADLSVRARVPGHYARCPLLRAHATGRAQGRCHRQAQPSGALSGT